MDVLRKREYNLEDRLISFAVLILDFVEKLPKGLRRIIWVDN
jgi:hypothetical protein